MLEWGEKIDFLLELQQAFGVTPKALERLPNLDFVQRKYLDIFQELSADREYTQAGGRLPITTKQRLYYVDYYQIYNLEERSRITYLTKAMDMAYLEYLSKKDKANEKAEKPTE
jgi:hypothetical protein